MTQYEKLEHMEQSAKEKLELYKDSVLESFFENVINGLHERKLNMTIEEAEK